jgi:uncharacterized protein YkwD
MPTPRFIPKLVAGLALLTALLAPSAATAEPPPAPALRIAMSASPAAIVKRINDVRHAHGLRPLKIATSLGRAATQHARSMARKGYFSHSGPDGSSPGTRIRRLYSGSTVGETLLWRSPGVSAAEAVRLWLASPPHRQILLHAAFTEIGVGVVRAPNAPGAFRGLDVTIVVADFGGH